MFFPGTEVVTRADQILQNLALAECLAGCRHVPSRTALEHVNGRIRTFFLRGAKR